MEVSLFGPGLPSSLTEGVHAEGLLVLDAATLFAAPRGMSDEALLSWDLDILTLNSTELMQTAAAIFRQSHVLQTFGIGAETLAHFLALSRRPSRRRRQLRRLAPARRRVSRSRSRNCTSSRCLWRRSATTSTIRG